MKYLMMLFLFYTSCFSLPGTKEIYQKLHGSWDSITPKYFSATVDGHLVNQQLKRIPKDKVEFEKKPYLQALFKKGFGLKLKVRHVDDYYRNYFSIYEDVFEKSGLYITLGKKDTYSKFIGNYLLYWHKAPEGFAYKLKIVEAEALPGDHGFFYLDEDWKLLKSEYFENNQEVATLMIEYAPYKNFSIVKSLQLDFIDQGKKRKMNLIFKDYSDHAFSQGELSD